MLDSGFAGRNLSQGNGYRSLLSLSSDPSVGAASSRAKAYRFLASIYLKAPTRQLIAEFLRKPSFSAESQGLKELGEFLSQNMSKSPELLEQDLAIEHLRLFGGMARGDGPLPPYESVWRGEGRVMGTATEKVLKAHAEAGVELTGRISEPPDHVGLELVFLSYLCEKENEARARNDAGDTVKCLHFEHQFLLEHLARWVPNFCQQIAENDRSGFYRAIAKLTEEFMLVDREAIEEQLRKYDRQSS
jgi:TorA maturation chaperone TorD